MQPAMYNNCIDHINKISLFKIYNSQQQKVHYLVQTLYIYLYVQRKFQTGDEVSAQ